MVSGNAPEPHPGSFRDPDGFIFQRDGIPYRLIRENYRRSYEHLIDSGLYAELVERGLLIPHDELPKSDDAFLILRPEKIPFVSYPYEWSFSQLKDAASLTLEIQRRALARGMSLKDASAYNIQFRGCKPVFIDTLSFEISDRPVPWIAYAQFCRHFLAPLALMSHRDVRLGELLRTSIDGIPLDLAAKLLPARSRLKSGLLLHLFLHARAESGLRHAPNRPDRKPINRGMSRNAVGELIRSLASAIASLPPPQAQTRWGDYYQKTHKYSAQAMTAKEEIVSSFLEGLGLQTLWDLGANSGRFSRVAAALGIQVASFDIDPVAVEENYQAGRAAGELRILPLLIDLSNPSPSQGWAHEERASLKERGPADGVLALALVHHLAITNHLPLPKIASFFHQICRRFLIIEFVEKSDAQIREMLATRPEAFPDYHEAAFEAAFAEFFDVRKTALVGDSARKIYLMERRD
jgi:hypothetical protein